VIGRSFLYRILRAIAEADRHLDEHLTELQALEFIREKQRMPELEYIFRHALAQEATYESILLQKRRELHGANRCQPRPGV
jgi:predicted ATPase